MSISRREFLIGGTSLLAMASLSKFADVTIAQPVPRVSEKSKKPDGIGFLEKEVDFLKDAESVGAFVETVLDMDSSERLPLSKKDGMKYSEIPEAVRTLVRKRPGGTLERRTKEFSKKYRRKFETLARLAERSGSPSAKGALERAALHAYYAARIFEGSEDERTIVSDFSSEMAKPRTGAGALEIDTETRLAIADLEAGANPGSAVFEIERKEFERMSEIFARNPSEGFRTFLEHLKGSVSDSRTEALSAVITISRTKLKTLDVLERLKTPSDRKEAFSEIARAATDFLNERAERSRTKERERSEIFESAVDAEIRRDLGRDFEAAVYYSMMDDFVLKAPLIEAVRKAFGDFSAPLSISKYLSAFESKVRPEDRKAYYSAKGTLLELSPERSSVPSEILKFLPEGIASEVREYAEFLGSGEFREIRTKAAEGEFESVKKAMASTSGRTKKFLAFALLSTSGFATNAISKGSPILEGNYDAERFEISNLKKREAKYNCMALSALGNFVIEELFGTEGLGMNFSRYRGKESQHQTNAIDLGNGEYLVSDITNDNYFFVREDATDLRDTYDVDRYANAYFSGALFNIHGMKARKYFDNLFYAVHSDITGNRAFEYLMRTQRSRKNNDVLLASREKMHEAMFGKK